MAPEGSTGSQRGSRVLNKIVGHPENQNNQSNKTEDEKELKTLKLANVSRKTPGAEQTLFNISMELKPGEVIGLYGRSMSGIDQLLEVVFGLYDRKREFGSTITIADKNIDLCNNRDWRCHFMFLEEEPLIFSGTVRENIDPFDKYDEDLIIKSLDFLKFNELVNSTRKQENHLARSSFASHSKASFFQKAPLVLEKKFSLFGRSKIDLKQESSPLLQKKTVKVRKTSNKI